MVASPTATPTVQTTVSPQFTVAPAAPPQIDDAAAAPIMADSEDKSACGVYVRVAIDSEGNGNSSDEGFTPDSEDVDDDEPLTAESPGSVAGEVEEEGINTCEGECVKGKTGELEQLMCSLDQMTQQERTTSLCTLLAVLLQDSTVESK
ncbi:hypothetical protein PHMEG_00019849 [Phytophthora megakarya]|uniref:Uncharacterized protein n=1 Tax=Phytophthora megakarya TaxID=4795 RepID=A0A225VQA4_9STRA|nr:hypothetical protein PHMEG_00019849 [Phytophthora megakarya]